MVSTIENADERQTSTGPPLRLEDFLPYRISVLAEAVREPLVRHYTARYDIGVPEWRIVIVLAQHGTTTAKEICRIGRMHKTKVSRALAFLETRGLVSREANVSDLRESLVSLTEEGGRLYGRLVAAAHDYSVRLGAVLSESEREAFEAVMQRLQARADALVREWQELYQPASPLR